MAALGRFAAAGFHDTSMDDIAEAAGVTKPVLYQHFGSKRTLYAELLDSVGAEMLESIAKMAATAGDGRAKVRAGFEAYFAFVCERTSAWHLLFDGAARQGGDSETVERLERDVAATIGDFIDAAIDDAHRGLLAYGIVGLAEVTARQWVLRVEASGADFDPAEAAQLAGRLSDMVWAGLRALPGSDRG